MDLRDVTRRYDLCVFEKARSDSLKTFRKVLDVNTGEFLLGVACCSICQSCIYYQKRNDQGKVTDYGTKNLIDHMKYCNNTSEGKNDKQQKLTSIFKPAKPSFSKSDQEKVRNAQAFLVAGAHLPFMTMDNQHFIKYSQCLLSVGAKYGNISTEQILVGRKTVKSDVVKLGCKVKCTIKSLLQNAISEKCIAFTTDLWSDNVVHRSYLDLSFFWVDVSGEAKTCWEIKSCMYACEHFPEAKTADNIGAYLDKILLEVGCDPINTPVVTDKGSNIVAATEQRVRLDCCCHRLNTAASTAWENCKHDLKSVDELDKASNNLVTFVKRTTGIQSELPRSLKHGGKTRPWRSLVNMFEAIHINLQDGTLKQLLQAKGKLGLLQSIDKTLLNDILDVLLVLKDVFDILEYSKMPTIQNCAPGYYLMRNQWATTSPKDSAEIRRIKRELVKALDDKVWHSLTSLHFLTTLLDPTLKSFRFVPTDKEREELLKQAREALLEYASSFFEEKVATVSEDISSTVTRDRESTSAAAESSETNRSTGQPQAKRRKPDPFEVFRVSQTQSSNKTIIETDVASEIRLYENLQGPFLIEDSSLNQLFDPLKWWGLKRYTFPVLSRIAKEVLVIPASSAESERHFSGAGKVSRKDRGRLKPESLESLVIVAEGLKKEIIK